MYAINLVVIFNTQYSRSGEQVLIVAEHSTKIYAGNHLSFKVKTLVHRFQSLMGRGYPRDCGSTQIFRVGLAAKIRGIRGPLTSKKNDLCLTYKAMWKPL